MSAYTHTLYMNTSCREGWPSFDLLFLFTEKIDIGSRVVKKTQTTREEIPFGTIVNIHQSKNEVQVQWDKPEEKVNSLVLRLYDNATSGRKKCSCVNLFYFWNICIKCYNMEIIVFRNTGKNILWYIPPLFLRVPATLTNRTERHN